MARRNRDPYHHAATPNLFAIHCEQCGKQLCRTPSGFLACPNGHGALREDRDDLADTADDTPSLFDVAAI
jgi:hypothetical protein